MSFDTQVVKANRGKAMRVDVSLDNFATVAYRWGDVAGLLDGTNLYSRRVLEVGAIRRAFGQQRIASSSSTSIVLDNADGALDWLCGNEGLADAAAARIRIYVCLYDEASASPTIESKLLGEFILSAWPTQDNATISLDLADDMQGRLGNLLLPTIADWQAVGTTANNPIKNSVGMPSSIGLNTPIQLAFGEDWVLSLPHLIPWRNNGTGEPYEGKIIIPLYSTTDTSAVSQNLIQAVRVEKYAAPNMADGWSEQDPGTTIHIVPINREYYDSGFVASGATPVSTWTVEKSPSITKGGKTFQIVYLVMRDDLGDLRFQNMDKWLSVSDVDQQAKNLAYIEVLQQFAYMGGYPQEAVDTSRVQYRAVAARSLRWWVLGVPLSQRTNPPTLLPIAHAVDVLRDLCSTYSTVTVDTASAARVKAGNPWAACAGCVQPWTERANNLEYPPPPMSLRQVLTAIAQSSDLDIFINWAGEVAFSSDVMDFTTATQGSSLIELSEKDIIPGSMRRDVPSNGERFAPFNRVYLEGGRENPCLYEPVPFQGPFDIDDADVPITTRVLEAAFQQGWRPFRQMAEDPFRWRAIDWTSRARVRFRTHRGALRLELGDYFKLTWTRGPDIGGPYASAAVFQVQAITYAPADDTVELEAIWRDDTVSERQYILDDETLLVRSKGALTGSCIFDGTEVVEFDNTINLATMGVQAGDILVLRSSAEAADSFTFNAAYRIQGVIGTTQLSLLDATGSAPSLAGPDVPDAEWSIVRGATTYPTVLSDPTNYPYGGDLYGKMTDASDNYSDTTQGNRLING